MSDPRSLEELVGHDDRAWPVVLEWIEASRRRIEVLPPAEEARQRTLLELQVTTRSSLGALAWESGGILVDGGWLRLLGSGHDRLTHALTELDAGPQVLVVAYDVLGGLFALGDGLGEAGKNVHYFAPDTLDWEDLEIAHAQFVGWAFGDGVDDFYEGERWSGWREAVKTLAGDEVFSFYPPPWSRERSKKKPSRKAVPVQEAIGVQLDMRNQIGGSS